MKSLLFSLIMSLLLFGCINEDNPVNNGISVGESLPNFSVTLESGSVISTESLRGKVAVIEFFNTGCGDCRRSFPIIQQLSDHFADDPDVMIFAIAREENYNEISSYWTANSLTIPFSPQPDRSVYNLFASVGIPRIYISDAEGVIIAAYGPEDDYSLQTLINIIRTASR